MPRISLVVCLHRERDLLARLLHESAGLYDDLVVVHDGPEDNGASHASIDRKGFDFATTACDLSLPDDYLEISHAPHPGSIHQIVAENSGSFFEGPRSFQQEPHWPFAWSRAQHDWILRLDADEFPSEELKAWLRDFRNRPEEDAKVPGYTCIWPMWDGRREVTRLWPAGRNFLFHRGRVRFFGMVEQVPMPDQQWRQLDLRLCHRPPRKSYGLANVLIRRQGYHWRSVISQSLLGTPCDLPRWRWSQQDWPPIWQRLRDQSALSGLYFLFRDTAAALRAQLHAEGRVMPLMAFATPLHHYLISCRLRKMQRHSKARP